jgi:hypothetical protein
MHGHAVGIDSRTGDTVTPCDLVLFLQIFYDEEVGYARWSVPQKDGGYE